MREDDVEEADRNEGRKDNAEEADHDVGTKAT